MRPWLVEVQAPGQPSPFASMQGNNKDSQAVNLQNLANMFSNSSTPLTAADLQKYQSAGLNMANFPSLPSVSSLLQPSVGCQERQQCENWEVCGALAAMLEVTALPQGTSSLRGGEGPHGWMVYAAFYAVGY